MCSNLLNNHAFEIKNSSIGTQPQHVCVYVPMCHLWVSMWLWLIVPFHHMTIIYLLVRNPVPPSVPRVSSMLSVCIFTFLCSEALRIETHTHTLIWLWVPCTLGERPTDHSLGWEVHHAIFGCWVLTQSYIPQPTEIHRWQASRWFDSGWYWLLIAVFKSELFVIIARSLTPVDTDLLSIAKNTNILIDQLSSTSSQFLR